MCKCPRCGTENKPTASFCRTCGTRLSAEAPVEPRKSQNKTPAAPPAARASGKKMGFWKLAAIPALILIAVAIFGPKDSCPTCDEILDLQKELQTVLKENEDNSLTFQDFDRWNTEVMALSSDIQFLRDHECDMPTRKVKEEECVYGRYVGSYTGEWKSTVPCGEGSFVGSYQEGSTRFVCIYSGTWSGGAPNGTGVLLEHREYQDNSSTENWTTRRYEGTFVDGKLTGSGWSSFESASGDRYEYFDGTYHNGYLEGQVNFLQYRDGELYDKGIAEGSKFIPIYSERQEVTDTLQTLGALVVVGVGLYELADLVFTAIDSEEFEITSGRSWIEDWADSLQASMAHWEEERAKDKTEKMLYDAWQSLEGRVESCETSKYIDEQEDAEYFRLQADEARKEYEEFKSSRFPW